MRLLFEHYEKGAVERDVKQVRGLPGHYENTASHLVYMVGPITGRVWTTGYAHDPHQTPIEIGHNATWELKP